MELPAEISAKIIKKMASEKLAHVILQIWPRQKHLRRHIKMLPTGTRIPDRAQAQWDDVNMALGLIDEWIF